MGRPCCIVVVREAVEEPIQGCTNEATDYCDASYNTSLQFRLPAAAVVSHYMKASVVAEELIG